MANEFTFSTSFTYTRGTFASLARSLASLGITVSADPISSGVLSVTVAEVAIPLGSVALADNILVVKNLDSTNFIELRIASGGAKYQKIKPGEMWPHRISTGVTAPFLIANVATCQAEYFLFSA